MNHSIKLFLHDSFLDALGALPKKIQKKTRELMKKFRANPTSSAINYEKISTFKDKSLRTIRVDQKYRAIIKAPTTGDGYHLLWVDNHDEAMNWAKNKVFEWNEHTQSFQMYDMPVVQTVPPPVESKGALASISKEDLLLLGTPESLMDMVIGLTSIEALNKVKDSLPIDNYEYLYYLLSGIDLAEILEEINAGKNEADAANSNNAQKHVYLLTDDDDLEEILSGNFEKWKIFLHPSQRSLAYRDFKGAVKVTGGAGTGKTVCAMHRLKYLVNKTDVFQKPVLFTTYTKSLTKYLATTLKEFDLPADYYVIQNFDKLIYDLAKLEGIISNDAGYLTETREKEIWTEVLDIYPSSKDETFLSREYNEVILQNLVETETQYFTAPRIGRTVRIGRKDKKEIWKLIVAYKAQKGTIYSKKELCMLLILHFRNQTEKPFSHLICDEIQDFSNIELSLMRALVSEKANDLFLVGDPYQNIYNRRINFSKSGINVRGRRSRKLKINYRTTEEIKLLAVKTVNQEKFDNFDGGEENQKGYVSLLHGNQPEYHTFSTPEEEDIHILKTLKEWLNQDAILASDICLCARTNAGVSSIKSLLHQHDYKYTDLSSQNSNSKAIKVSSFHNLKGHEFKMMVVTDVSANTVPLSFAALNTFTEKERQAYYKQERALYYVVFTRAIQGLLITGVGKESEWF
jgi:hypothetical protein